jgi:hypothetical protein
MLTFEAQTTTTDKQTSDKRRKQKKTTHLSTILSIKTS